MHLKPFWVLLQTEWQNSVSFHVLQLSKSLRFHNQPETLYSFRDLEPPLTGNFRVSPGSKSHTEYKFLSSLPNDITVYLHITGSISVLVTKQLKPAPQYKFMYHAPRSHGGVNFCSVSVACAASSWTSRHNKRCEPSLTQSSGQRTISVEGPSGLRLF